MLVTNSMSANMSSSTPDSSAKKMKQMRLPFGKIDRNSAIAKMETEVRKGEEESKKRKASTSSTEGSETGGKEEAAAKVKVKIGSAKKKAKTEIKENEVIVLSDDESEVAKDTKKTEEVKATNEEIKPAKKEPEIVDVDKSDDKTKSEDQIRFSEGEKILCFSGPLIYEAKILKVETDDKKTKYLIHYHGWNKSWDEWVDEAQILKHTELNLEKKRDLDKAHEAENAEIFEVPVEDKKSTTPKDSDQEENLEEKKSQTAPNVFKTPEASMKRKSESTPEVSSEKVKKLTPKQIAYKEKLEMQRKEKEAKKEAEKQAKEAERQKEKDRKEAEKQKEKERKEAERKAKEAQKETERLEKEKLKQEKEMEKLKEKERKEAERKAKESQKEAEKLLKEEQARKKQEEKDEKEKAEKAKAEKAKMSFASFFVKKQKTASEPLEAQGENSLFTQFQVKSNMKVAPILRGLIPEDFELNTGLPNEQLYLNQLSKGQIKPGKQSRTWPYASKVDDDDVEILEDEEDEDDIGEEILNESLIKPTEKKVFKKAKLLQFHDNQRPAYFGTWTKKTSKISGRKPFGKDIDLIRDYDYDSDDDWEEEEQGESLSDEEKDNEEDEKEDEKLDEDDDGFFVGHGVLDKDELRNDDEDDEAFDEELEMKKQKLKAQQFEEEYKKKKTTKLKPRVFGCFWNDPAHAQDKDDQVRINHESFIKILNPFKAVVLQQIGLIQTSLSKPKAEEKESPNTAQPPKAKVLKEFPESAMLDLIKLVHANTNNKLFLAREFVEYWSSKNLGMKLSQQLTLKKLQEIADYQKHEGLGRRCWVVKDDILKSFNVMEPEIPNNWEYLLEVPKKAANSTPSTITPSNTPSTSTSATPSKKDKEEFDVNATPKTSSQSTPKVSNAATPKTSQNTPKVSKATKTMASSPALLITKFTKKLTEAEREEQRLKVLRESKPKPASKPAPTPKAPGNQQPTIIDLTQN